MLATLRRLSLVPAMALAAAISTGLALVFAVSAHAVPAVGVNVAGDTLRTFDTGSPGSMSSLPITGLSGYKVRALDVRPAGGVLWGVGADETTNHDWKLFRIDVATGAATPGIFAPGVPDGTSFGLDISPVDNVARVVQNNDINFRLDTVVGNLVSLDSNLFDPADTEEVVAAAYDRNFAGATVTTLFGIDYLHDRLVRVGDVDGGPMLPDFGQLTTIGSLGIVTLNRNIGFDIAPSGTAFVTATPFPGGMPMLYTANLSTGALAAVGQLAQELGGFALLPVPATAPTQPPASSTSASTPTQAKKKCKKKKKGGSAAKKCRGRK